MPLSAAFAIAAKFKDHKMLLKMVYIFLVTRFGPDRVQRRFEMMGTPSFTKKEQDTTLITLFVTSGLSQQEYARRAAAYNQGSPPHQRIGTVHGIRRHAAGPQACAEAAPEILCRCEALCGAASL
jgi:hypothetical protein